jgi:hypothetical protein
MKISSDELFEANKNYDDESLKDLIKIYNLFLILRSQGFASNKRF